MGRKIKPVLTHGTITILGTSNLTCNAVPVPVGPYRIHIRVRILCKDFITSGVTEEPSPAAEGIHQNEGNLEGNRDPQATMGIPFEPPDGKENNLMLNEMQ